jgi:hypothetical protein
VDLAIANVSSDDVSVLLGLGDGTFAAVQRFVVGNGSSSKITTEDFNGDGFVDLATSGYFGVTVLLNQSSGGGVVEVAPNSFTVTRGDYVSGGIPELAERDNLDLSLRRLISDIQSRTEFEVKAVVPPQFRLRLK